jgi:chromosome segregation protein
MRLEKIVLNGFKSFADATEFIFESPVTAIVGPNGCGKSNVVDAVKWVLGEQSVKSLRSGQMADVIFGGSSTRKPLGAAEVSLFLSNPQNIAGRQLPVDAETVQVTRKIFRSGESEYRINNKPCRLKDIRELFMDTGVGTRAYSILEQGQVDHLVNASATDRRSIFEEAAGISKYKAHKKEAMRKLENTEQNLLRLADILAEITKQLRSVKLQAGKARSYLQYSQRLKDLQVNYSLVEYDRHYSLAKEKETVFSQQTQQSEQLCADVARQDSLLSTLGEQLIETEHKLNTAGNSLVSVRSAIEQKLQRIDFLRSKVTELQARKTSAEQKSRQLQQQKGDFEINLNKHKTELADFKKMLEEKNRELEQLQAAIGQINSECLSLETALQDEKSGIIDIVRRTAQLHNEIQSISVYRNNLSSQKDRLAGRAQNARAELEDMLAQKAQYESRLADIEKVLCELKDSLEKKRAEAENLRTGIAADGKKLAHSKENRSALKSELSVLTDMEKRYEGLKTAVKNILQSRSSTNNRFDYIEGVLAEMLSTDIQYANAVEAALEGRTDALVINSTSKLLADTETVEKLQGRVEFLCLDAIEPFVDNCDWSEFPSVKGRLVEFVKCDGRYSQLAWKLLGKTLLVESLDDAVELAGKVDGFWQFVTVDGAFLSSDGTVRLGPLGKAAGLISRKSRLQQLQEIISKVSAEITDLEGQIERNTAAHMHLEKLCNQLRTSVYEASTEKMQVTSKLEMFGQSIKRLREEEPLIAGEIDLIAEQIAQSVQKEYNSKQKLQELEQVNNQRAAQIAELEMGFAQKKQQKQTLENKLTEVKVAVGKITEQSRASQQLIDSVQRQLQENTSAVNAALDEIQSCLEQEKVSLRDILGCEAEVSELFIEKEKHLQDSQLLQQEIDDLLLKQKQAQEQLKVSRTQKEQLEQQTGQLKVELAQLQVRIQDLVESVRQQLQMDLVEAYKNYSQSDSGRIDWEKIKEEIAELRGKIERLGNVNIEAIAEQEELEKRNEFLSNQVQDLNSSKGQLQQLISRLNKKSREKFQETFDLIRSHFQEIFRILFGGGKADIMLEEAEDILDAGIEVIAKPPGKETRSISLLSGGEKSMTAMALLFAVFKAKPSPFCFLDEVDAALDEANNERFNTLLREFKKDSQFVVITHSKRTMSMADQLFGITMQIRGVSKKISIRFGEVEEEQPAAVA